MDVVVRVDKLDDLVHNAKPVPLTDQVRVDKEEIYDILDQMRATIPEEIKQARWIVKERQEMLAEAKREAERIVKESREQQTRLVSQEEVTKQAERAAEDIIEEARGREREHQSGMDTFVQRLRGDQRPQFGHGVIRVTEADRDIRVRQGGSDASQAQRDRCRVPGGCRAPGSRRADQEVDMLAGDIDLSDVNGFWTAPLAHRAEVFARLDRQPGVVYSAIAPNAKSRKGCCPRRRSLSRAMEKSPRCVPSAARCRAASPAMATGSRSRRKSCSTSPRAASRS